MTAEEIRLRIAQGEDSRERNIASLVRFGEDTTLEFKRVIFQGGRIACFDEQVVADAEVSDLQPALYRAYRTTLSSPDDWEFLRKMHFVAHDDRGCLKPTVGGLLMAGERPDRFDGGYSPNGRAVFEKSACDACRVSWCAEERGVSLHLTSRTPELTSRERRTGSAASSRIPAGRSHDFRTTRADRVLCDTPGR